MEAGPPTTTQSQSLHFDGLCRLIGEVKQACNLTIKIGQEARGRPNWHLGVTFRNAVSQGKILNGPCQVFKSPSGRLLLELIQPTLAGLRSTK